MAWIKVTDPEGNPVYICVEQMVRVHVNVPASQSSATAGSAARANPQISEWASVKSVIDLVNGIQAVQETQAEIMAMLDDADGQSEGRSALARKS